MVIDLRSTDRSVKGRQVLAALRACACRNCHSFGVAIARPHESVCPDCHVFPELMLVDVDWFLLLLLFFWGGVRQNQASLASVEPKGLCMCVCVCPNSNSWTLKEWRWRSGKQPYALASWVWVSFAHRDRGSPNRLERDPKWWLSFWLTNHFFVGSLKIAIRDTGCWFAKDRRCPQVRLKCSRGSCCNIIGSIASLLA